MKNTPRRVIQGIRPVVNPDAHQLQEYGRIVRLPIGLTEKVCSESCANLNQVMADTMAIRDLYKKHHWQVAGHTFYQFHLLYDKHYEEQDKLVDEIAERIQTLGGISIAMAQDVADLTQVPRPPMGREMWDIQIERLLQAHEIILLEARAGARQADHDGDVGTSDLLISAVVRTNELQVWFLSEHLMEKRNIEKGEVAGSVVKE